MRHIPKFAAVGLGVLTAWLALSSATLAHPHHTYDLVIYGGTSGGIAAAIQARRMDKTAIIIEPGQHLGGLTSGGLGATDIGNKAAIGGISREFYQRVRKHYSDPAAWKFEKPEQYRSGRGSETGKEDAMWTFEPSVAEKIYVDWLKELKVPVVFGERLDLKRGIEKKGARILSITMESGKTYEGRRFIDATYEGDLLAKAGVSYHVGREANSVYGETLNGVQTKNAIHHQMHAGVDPYVKKGDKSSGLLPGVVAGPPGEEGSGDKRVQAYNFRMCLTDAPENRLPIEKPAGYDEQRYELLFRNFEAGEKRTPWAPTRMPNRKTDINNNFGFSTDNIGLNYNWPDADHETREKMFEEHRRYQIGLVWTLQNHPRVPEAIRKATSNWGYCKDEFTATGGWPHQLYVREARRMISDYVMTQADCQGKRACDDPVGLGAYNMDSHNVQRYVDENGHARNEGDVQVGVSPYPISYRSIVPKQKECDNLLVPVCLAASHISYGSIRMEPVFMVLGQSAATAACQSIDADVPVQQVDYAKLSEQLLKDKQVLTWTGPKRAVVESLDPKKLEGIVIDDAQAEKKGDWSSSASIGGFVGASYLHDANEGQGKKSITFPIKVTAAGAYEVRFYYTPNANRATNVPVVVKHADGEKKLTVDEKQATKNGYVVLGTFAFKDAASVQVSNQGANGYVVVDAVQLVPVKQ